MAVLPVPLPSAKMATVEKRRPTVIPPAGFTDSGRQSVSQAAGATESEEDFLRQVGVTEMLRAALLKVLEARPEEPIAFLAHYFENMGLRSPVNGGAGEPPGQLLLQQQRLGRALWHLRLAHHSQRDLSPTSDGSSACTGSHHVVTSTGKSSPCPTPRSPPDLAHFPEPPLSGERRQRCAWKPGVRAPAECPRCRPASPPRARRSPGQTSRPSRVQTGDRKPERTFRPGMPCTRTREEAQRVLMDVYKRQALDRAVGGRRPSAPMTREEFLERAAALFIAKVKPVG
nr:tubulin polyglutamylase complex subunit 1 [Aotus nancymaae]